MCEKRSMDLSKKSPNPEGSLTVAESFRKLRLRIKTGLLLAFLAPLAVLSLYFHFQFNTILKETGKLHLAALAESQRNTIDLFIQERLVNIFNLFHGSEFSPEPDKLDMDLYLQGLKQASDAFIDIGFFDEEGVHIGYAGPLPSLLGKNYGEEDWFKTLVTQKKNYHVSDVHLGFRRKPHFTIAVKQTIGNRLYVMRATIDPQKFYFFLHTASEGKGINSAVINAQGHYQLVNPNVDSPLRQSDYQPIKNQETWVEEVGRDGDSVVIAYARLKETPWVLVVEQPFRIAFARMYQFRRIMIGITAALVISIGGALWITSGSLLKKAQSTAEKKEDLKFQLLHASKLAAVGELAAGVAHEINNPLAAIAANSGVIRDMIDPQFHLDWTPEEMREELDNIDAMVFRARGIISKLMGFSRKYPQELVPCNVNLLLDDVVGGLKEREFQVSDIEVIRDYDPQIPEILLDPDQMRQVFLNLINNAGDAIEGAGTIRLTTRTENGFIRITFEDTGTGIPPEEMEKIFLPFHTTKEVGKGTGLGLSISLSIVESVGGSIEVQSTPGRGSLFTVILPISQIQGS